MPGPFKNRRTSNLTRRSITDLESTLTDRILEAVSKAPGCRIEDVVGLFPDLTWNRIFRELGRLSRNRQVRLVVNRQGITLREC